MDHVICVGSAAKDIFFPTADGEFLDTPEDVTAQKKVAFEVGAKYQIEDRYEALGGVAANTSVGLARLGVEASCYGATGDDDIGVWIRRALEREGVDTKLLEKFPNVKSDLSSILVFTKDGERTIFYNRDAAERLHVEASKLSGASWVVVSALNGEWKENLRQTIAGQALIEDETIMIDVSTSPNSSSFTPSTGVVPPTAATKSSDVAVPTVSGSTPYLGSAPNTSNVKPVTRFRAKKNGTLVI